MVPVRRLASKQNKTNTTGKYCIGVELDNKTNSGHDGTFGGDRYFECENGKGVFVVPKRITYILKKAVQSSLC